MMKKLLSLSLCALLLISCFTTNLTVLSGAETTNSKEFTQTAQNFCSNIIAGWNLGNTLDACQSWGNIPDEPTPNQQETGWNNPTTTQSMIDFVARSGINAIRIPVSWSLQLTEKNGKYTIKSDWMTRVKEIVGYAEKNNMYIIVNMHHDDQTWLNISASNSEWTKIKEKYKQLWGQIAYAFKDYNEKLILEGANEITATKSFDKCGSGSGKCWWGHSEEVFERQNELYQIFVDTVRASGGNNDKRYLMLPTYGAQWYSNQIQNLVIPNNDQHIIMDIHWYSGSSTNAGSNTSVFNVIKNYCDRNNIAAVIGECGFSKTTSDSTKINWAKNFVKPAKQLGIPCFLWDDGGDMAILNRDSQEPSWNSTLYVRSVVNNSKSVMVLGDANGNGEFSITDINYMARYLAKRPGFSTISNLADVNKDNEINLVDYYYMRKVFAELMEFDDIK